MFEEDIVFLEVVFSTELDEDYNYCEDCENYETCNGACIWED